VGQGGAGGVVRGEAALLGDDPGERGGVAQPHLLGVVAQRGGAGHQVGEGGEAGVAVGGDQPGGQGVFPQCGGDRLALGAFADGREQVGLLVGVLVEDEGLLDREVLEQGGGGHVGGVRDLADADRVVPVLQEQAQCGVGDGPAGGGLLAFAAPHRRGGGACRGVGRRSGHTDTLSLRLTHFKS
jgi:hypothetical protein